MDELAICAIFRNEAPYIQEWLSYHYAQGVRRFVLYDNASSDGTRAVIDAWPRRDLVDVIDWPQQGGQLHAYLDMVTRFRSEIEWCAFIDCDEFLTPQSWLSLPDVLRRIGREANGLYVHWWMFGSSGHLTRQPGLVTETFRWRAPNAFGSHLFGKSVMRLATLTHVGLHVFRCQGRMVNDAGEEIDQLSAGGQSRASHGLLALNHYFTKSREEWIVRRSLGKADKPATDPDFLRAEQEFAQHDINAVYDDRAALFMQAARAMFYLPPAPVPQPLPVPANLLTVHGTLVCWDTVSERALHRMPDQLSATIVPIRCVPDAADQTRCRLLRGEEGPAPIDGSATFTMQPAGPGAMLHLRSATGYLCAEGGSPEMHANRDEASEWETFVPLPIEATPLLRRAPPSSARVLPGFQLLFGGDRYDLQWSVPLARLGLVAEAPPPTTQAAGSLNFYDLSEDTAARPSAGTTLAPSIGPGLEQLRAAGRAEMVQSFGTAETLARPQPFLAAPVGSPLAPYATLFVDPAYRSYAVPEMACYALRNACILGGDGLIWCDGALLRDSVHSLEPWRAETLSAEPPAAGAAALQLKRDIAVPEPRLGVFFCGFVGAWRNYAHWLTECLPRLFAFRALRARRPELRLVLPRLETGSAQAQTLALLGIGADQVVFLGNAEPLAGEIWTMTSIEPWAVPRTCRDAAQALGAEAAKAGPPGRLERIYIRRGTETRRMLTLPELRPVLQRYEVTVVTMQDLSLAEQARTMQAARMVIGENGAALANIMFCRPGARVLELFNEAWANPAHWTLAALCGLDYAYVEGRHRPSDLAQMPSHNADYAITADQLESGLRALLEDAGPAG